MPPAKIFAPAPASVSWRTASSTEVGAENCICVTFALLVASSVSDCTAVEIDRETSVQSRAFAVVSAAVCWLNHYPPWRMLRLIRHETDNVTTLTIDGMW